jgi:hypothetical protein
MTAEKIASDRALALLFSQASGQRVLATEIHGGAKELAASHHRTAERLNQLARRASEIWADADRLAALAANAANAEEAP